eukprot:GHVH01012521.1.p1 GENE.GHVH01012521.1~~GHVH01012521.1.p1  ORF type:complete len:336 (+),score=50.92 GHVH01012521.1:45-1052(+)
MSGQTGFYRGTTTEQVSYFKDKEKDALESRNWPSIFFESIDFSKINLNTTQQWIEQSVEEILGHEDDIVSDMTFSALELAADRQKKQEKTSGSENIFCARKLALSLEGFMGDELTGPTQAMQFVGRLVKKIRSGSSNGDCSPPGDGRPEVSSSERLVDELKLVKYKAAQIAAGIAQKFEISRNLPVSVRPPSRPAPTGDPPVVADVASVSPQRGGNRRRGVQPDDDNDDTRVERNESRRYNDDNNRRSRVNHRGYGRREPVYDDQRDRGADRDRRGEGERRERRDRYASQRDSEETRHHKRHSRGDDEERKRTKVNEEPLSGPARPMMRAFSDDE